MFKKIVNLWGEYKFEIIILGCILFIIIFSMIRILTGKKGSWTRFLPKDMYYQKTYPHRQQVPRESRGERECRRVLENIFRKPFIKARPYFLNNPVTGGECNLEIDCFNKDLKLGCEYSGLQHYKYIPYFHKNKEGFLNQKYRDEMKRTKCRENGITLIEVPYNIRLENIEKYIKNELLRIYGILK